MNNLEIYNNVFVEIFGVTVEQLNVDFTSDNVEKWDSVTQMALLAALEDSFDVMLETDDVFDLVSYEAGKDILKKYGVEI